MLWLAAAASAAGAALRHNSNSTTTAAWGGRELQCSGYYPAETTCLNCIAGGYLGTVSVSFAWRWQILAAADRDAPAVTARLCCLCSSSTATLQEMWCFGNNYCTNNDVCNCPGSYALTSAQCCTAGKYKSGSSCLSCACGRYSTAAGATSCTGCTAGRYVSVVGSNAASGAFCGAWVCCSCHARCRSKRPAPTHCRIADCFPICRLPRVRRWKVLCSGWRVLLHQLPGWHVRRNHWQQRCH